MCNCTYWWAWFLLGLCAAPLVIAVLVILAVVIATSERAVDWSLTAARKVVSALRARAP